VALPGGDAPVEAGKELIEVVNDYALPVSSTVSSIASRRMVT
jgi:hypothetical protein